MTMVVPVIEIGDFANADEATRNRIATEVSSALSEIIGGGRTQPPAGCVAVAGLGKERL